ncbi:type VII secretion protein EccCa [Corynebacterium sp. ES2794-CONJ1]|uniref:type VII secretion protein EccCa n=1 Tax=Corynebacterium sp. ES2794-CONJ1 TaxID=2980553 RepID=UPI0021DA070F|nr:type VII secretion protein EccCa [Corynebacterium sp. ES2794-CONJ1]MCU9518885.1 type VII secretion protein EccCa [Corynebacterium sp. ES2794-CONJ1]
MAPPRFSTVVAPISLSERDAIPPLPTQALVPDPVPAATKPKPMPVMRIVMPLVMVLAIGAMVALMVINGGTLNPMMLIFPIMMLMGMLMMFSPQPGEDTDEIRRRYLRHLSTLRTQAAHNHQAQRLNALHEHPAPVDLWNLLGTNRMWERNAYDPDALALRIGLGETTLATPIELDDQGNIEDLDPVCAVSVRHMVKALSVVPDMPIVVQLQAFRALDISGSQAHGLLRAVVAHLVTFHGPDTVGIELHGETFRSWAKWLPHTHPVAVEKAAEKILILDNKVPASKVKELVAARTWTTIIAVNSQDKTLKKLADDDGLVLEARSKDLVAHTEAGAEALGVADYMGLREMTQLARKLSAYRRPDAAGSGGSQDFLSLLGIEDISAATLEKLWQPRGARRLAVPVGVDDAGAPLIIDIKESAHGGMGPHGLCVGATGSGKSELLRTLVIALAATHSPAVLNFVLVDFKGGATFLGMDTLPHTSAVITNLAEESVLVERMHDAISGEMNRRQELLRTAGKFSNVDEYNAACLKDDSLKPIPALVIVLDEFSELLGQHPDFADLFVAVGRLGRSLHIHLLLASQRLEEGRLRGLDSHLSYRIGLRTFSAAESRQVLGVPDAHHLPSKPGAGFMKTDADRLKKFQASYISGPWMRPDYSQNLDQLDCRGVRIFDGWEYPQEEKVELHVADPRGTIVDAVIESAQEVAHKYDLSAHRLWLPPLPEELPIAQVAGPQPFLHAAVGLIDRPYHQRQDPFIIDFTGSKGHLALAGGPQTGKTTALRTIITSLAVTHSTKQIRFYILDLAGKDLSDITLIPHCAAVAHRGDVEKINRIVDEVLGFIDAPAPEHTFLVIDGWHTVGSDYENLLAKLGRIAADGLAARVHLVISTARWTALRPAIKDLIANRLELKISEALDSVIDRKAQLSTPDLPGRGLNTAAESILFARSTAQDLAHIASVTKDQDHVRALQMLPQHLSLDSLLVPATGSHARTTEIVLGIGGARLEPITWDTNRSLHVLCFGSQASGKSTALATIMRGICQLGAEKARIVLIDHRRHHLGTIKQDMLAAYCASSASTEQTIAATVVTLKSRLPEADITPAELKARSWWQGPDIYLVIDDLEVVADYLLQPLVELLPHARDIGLHVIIARKSGGVVRALYQPLLSELKDQSPLCLILDADKDDGPILGIKPRALIPGRATMVLRGHDSGLIHIAEPEQETDKEQ